MGEVVFIVHSLCLGLLLTGIVFLLGQVSDLLEVAKTFVTGLLDALFLVVCFLELSQLTLTLLVEDLLEAFSLGLVDYWDEVVTDVLGKLPHFIDLYSA